MMRGVGKSDNNKLTGHNGASSQRTSLATKDKSTGHTSRSPNSANTGTIATLSSVEKEKVKRLVQRLVELGQDHEVALASLQEEKNMFVEETSRQQRILEEQLATISDKLESKDNEIRELEVKNSLSTGLLALYQTKLKNSADMFRFYELSANDSKSKIKQLESDSLSLQTLVASQKLAIESFENSRTRQAAAMHDLRTQHNEAEERLKAEISVLTEKLKHRDIQIDELKKQLNSVDMVQHSLKTGARSDPMTEKIETHQSSIVNVTSVADSTKPSNYFANVSQQPLEPIHYGLSNTSPASEVDIGIYAPMYSSIDTSVISFSSSHYENNQQDLSIIEMKKEVELAGEGQAIEQEHHRSARIIPSANNIYEENQHTNQWSRSHASVARTTEEGVRSTLDPTPMKRKTAPPATKTYSQPAAQSEPHLNDSLGSRMRAEIAALRSQTLVDGKMRPVVEEEDDARIPPVKTTSSKASHSDTPPLSKEKKKKKKVEVGGKTHHSEDLPKSVCIVAKKKKSVVRKDPLAPKKLHTVASPVSAQRHHTFSAASTTSASYDSTLLKSAPLVGSKSLVVQEERRGVTRVPSSSRVREQSINYDDSLFDLLSEMDRT